MARISTLMQYRFGEQQIAGRQRELLSAQLQLSSGRRIATPSDDPLGAADASTIRSGLSRLVQYKDNQGHARFLLNQAETVVSKLGEAVVETQERLVAAGNGAYGDQERRALARDLQGLLDRIVGLANSQDGAGGYLFAGTRDGAAPFVQNGNLVAFRGDGTSQRLEVANDRLLQVKFSGDDLLLKIRPGNGSFVTAADAGNTGAASIDAGAVTSPAALSGSAYTIDFDGASYVVTRLADSAQTVVAPSASGPTTIELDGMRVTLNGTAAAGDRFTIAPAGYQSLFDTLGQAIAMLQTPLADAAARARFNSTYANVLASVEQAADHLRLKRAESGSALSELDGYEQVNEERSLEHEARRSTVEDLDYAQAASELTRRQTAFEAAIRSYSVVSKLSLFNYL
jgi:flagellar hook-associated protein 3 FlgL